MHSGEDIVFVMLSLSVFIRSKLKSLLDCGGNRTRDIWFASPMLYQLSYEVKSVSVGDISELSLVPSILVFFYDLECFYFWGRLFKVGLAVNLKFKANFLTACL